MGSTEQRYPADGEGPPRIVHVAAFRIAVHAVRNDDFAAFVSATGYLTTAEREGWSFVFGGLLPADFPPTRAVAEAPWWRQVPGACWHRPEGATSNVAARENHPVVHVSWLDAREYWTRGSTVGGRPPGAANGYRLHNATGNVWEWCADRFGPSRPGERNMRGGSYLCHESYCWRYRCAARSANTPDSSAGNIGFRMAADLQPADGWTAPGYPAGP